MPYTRTLHSLRSFRSGDGWRWAKNAAMILIVDHSTTDQCSILRFIEDNWNLERIGDDSFDAKAGVLDNMFDFESRPAVRYSKLFLDPETGQPLDGRRSRADKDE